MGDPFKDTASPALHPLIKVMNLISLLVLSAVIALRDSGVGYVIAAMALAGPIGAIAWSKRSTGTAAFGTTASAAAAAGI